MPMKNPGTPKERYKASPVIQGHKDIEKGYLVRTSKTNKYNTIQLMVTLSLALNFKIWSKDVAGAYIQFHDLTRAVYTKPDSDFNLPSNDFLKLLKPISGLT